MIKNYLTIISRQLLKNKDFSIINLLGLAIGMSACLIINHLVFFHISFDQYHAKSEKVYRITADVNCKNEAQSKSNQISAPLGKEITSQSPDVESIARFWNLNYLNNAIRVSSQGQVKMADQEKVYGADKSAFEIFDLPILHGSYEKFDQPNKIILDETSAKRIFRGQHIDTN